MNRAVTLCNTALPHCVRNNNCSFSRLECWLVMMSLIMWYTQTRDSKSYLNSNLGLELKPGTWNHSQTWTLFSNLLSKSNFNSNSVLELELVVELELGTRTRLSSSSEFKSRVREFEFESWVRVRLQRVWVLSLSLTTSSSSSYSTEFEFNYVPVLSSSLSTSSSPEFKSQVQVRLWVWVPRLSPEFECVMWSVTSSLANIWVWWMNNIIIYYKV